MRIFYGAVALLAGAVLSLIPNPVRAAAPGFGPTQAAVPEVAREFRGTWIASVWNLDWPSKPGLSSDRQKAELIRILDRAQQLKLNAVLLQVRPNSDALYASRLEPWSPWLTGKMGEAPSPYYDPLEFAVAEAHRRGLQLHAWFNPFRALASSSQAASPNHVSRRHPDWLVRFDKGVWLDPAHPGVREHVINVILDVVRRYNIDGVHIDDYFYPYPVVRGGRPLPFKDDATFARYGRGIPRADWRRENINSFVRNLNDAIKRTRPGVLFGVSPFGIWRPRVPSSIEAGVDAYNDLFADSRRWLQEGWLDYLAPQLYWSIEPAAQSFPVLLDWWAAQNPRGRHLWPGIAPERIGPKRNASEIINQIKLVRRSPATGEIHWSVKSLMSNKGGIANLLPGSVYAAPAVVPPSPWLSAIPPARPDLRTEPAANGVTFLWEPGAGTTPRQWVVQQRFGNRWNTLILPAEQRQITVRETMPHVFAVTALSATGISSVPAAVGRGE